MKHEMTRARVAGAGVEGHVVVTRFRVTTHRRDLGKECAGQRGSKRMTPQNLALGRIAMNDG